MLENLQKGDKLFRGEGHILNKAEIVTVFDSSIVWYRAFGNSEKTRVGMSHFLDLEADGWQLEKKKWVPADKELYFYMADNGRINAEYWGFVSKDFARQEINNVHKTYKEAEAYRNKLVEVMGKE